jgi:hypothetical protein
MGIFLRDLSCGKKRMMGGSKDATARPGQPDGTIGALDQVRVRILPDGRLTREDAARYLGHQPKTLARWQLEGHGPKSVLVGGRRFYFKRDLDAFIRGEVA